MGTRFWLRVLAKRLFGWVWLNLVLRDSKEEWNALFSYLGEGRAQYSNVKNSVRGDFRFLSGLLISFHIFYMSVSSVYLILSKLSSFSEKSLNTKRSFFVLFWSNSFKLTSKMILSSPRFEASNLPISVVHIFIITTSARASASKQVVCSNFLRYSPLSLLSVPSMSKNNNLLS